MTRGLILISIAAGGALGSLARYGLSRALTGRGGGSFPYGTLAANLLGCLLIGICFIWLERRGSPAFRDFVRVGFLGGLTTFSTFAIESVSLMEKGQYGAATVNVVGSVLGCLAAALAGVAVGRWIFGA